MRSTGAEPGYSLKKYHYHVASHTVSPVLCVRQGGVGLSVHVVVFGAPTLSSGQCICCTVSQHKRLVDRAFRCCIVMTSIFDLYHVSQYLRAIVACIITHVHGCRILLCWLCYTRMNKCQVIHLILADEPRPYTAIAD